jgi:hypothetical protein
VPVTPLRKPAGSRWRVATHTCLMHFPSASIGPEFVTKLGSLVARIGATLLHPGLKKVSILSQEDGDQIWVEEPEFWSQLNGDRIAFQYWLDRSSDAACCLSTCAGGVLVDLDVPLPALDQLRDVAAGRILFDRDVRWSVGYTAWESFARDWVDYFCQYGPMPTEPYWLICREHQASPFADALGLNNHVTAFGYASNIFGRRSSWRR